MVMYWLKSRKEVTTDLPQYQRDFDLSPQDDHSMFWEYLEVGRYMYQLRCSAVPELSLVLYSGQIQTEEDGAQDKLQNAPSSTQRQRREESTYSTESFLKRTQEIMYEIQPETH